MPTKWLECNVQYNPENSASKQYLCSFVDCHKRETTVRVGAESVYVEYVGPPCAPYLTKGYLRVDLADYGDVKGIILFPVRSNHGVNDTTVLLTALSFTPPPAKKTQCIFRKRK